ncbi:MBL fold metallo-hydrolase RNA specificity domain-containing protein [Planctomycetes bacterium K23_9]|uniref:Ribonuclease n=1 Tax=Stieleria marina TaxID=1930275 RepID=A0A517NNE4_9BACT|nr:Ribonuclease [Planctomycetes bacterium K23_9]
MKLIHHGAYDGVTGSCHELRYDDKKSLLVDCGIFQGDDAKKHPNPEIEFSLDPIQSLLLTHVHIDHIGRVPYLFAAGFDKPIYCSEPTAKLVPLVIEDALRIGFTRSRRLIKKFLNLIDGALVPLPYGKWHAIHDGIQIRLSPAGHVLGSTIFEVKLPSKKIVVFTGDIGPGNDPLLKKPVSPPQADLLVMESTYGDKLHETTDDREAHLEKVIRHTLEDLGVTIIPAFSLGRTQSLLYELNRIFERVQKAQGSTLLKRIDVIVDSPLASRFTELYKEMSDYWRIEAQHHVSTKEQPLVFENLVTVGDHREHKSTLDYLAKHELPAIVIAGSGMCTGGRVVNYLKRFLSDKRTDVVFVGYQASGTPGHHLVRGSQWVRLQGRKHDVAADIHRISGYSAHADQAGLIDFVASMDEPPKQIRLVHGDYRPKRILREKLTAMGYDVD